MKTYDYDIFIIGGGINGCGIARDAAGRGLKTGLCEQNDLASGASSASSKLIHGGLRYLEHYEFGLVRESLKEREILYQSAPHLVNPMEFVLPHHPALRPKWLLRLGLFFYDCLKPDSILPKSKSIKLSEVLKPEYENGFSYFDCCVDDARLVIINAQDAAINGADIRNYTQCLFAKRHVDHWELTLKTSDKINDKTKDKEFIVTSRALVNATGPWLCDVKNSCFNANELAPSTATIRKVKGSHIILRKWYRENRSYILQNDDKRVVFIIPYKEEFVIVGTTDVEISGDPGNASISPAEATYLIDVINRYFDKPHSLADISGDFCGVRPLFDDGNAKAQETTRDYKILVDNHSPGSPLVNVYGGKLTTYRHLAELAIDKLTPFFHGTGKPLGKPWTNKAALPGGDFDYRDSAAYLRDLIIKFPLLPATVVESLFSRHGSMTNEILKNARSIDDLGFDFGHSFFEIEVAYLIDNEWAKTASDLLWRRTKLGLVFTPDEVTKLKIFVSAYQ